MNPYIYILFILLLPANTNRSLLLIIAFFTGLTVDFFAHTLGLHAAASVFIAYLRPGTIRLFLGIMSSPQEKSLVRHQLELADFSDTQ